MCARVLFSTDPQRRHMTAGCSGQRKGRAEALISWMVSSRNLSFPVTGWLFSRTVSHRVKNLGMAMLGESQYRGRILLKILILMTIQLVATY